MLHSVKMFTFPSASVIFFVDFSLVVLITCVINISIVTLLDCLNSSFFWLQKVFKCENSLSKHFDIGPVFHLCVMKFGDCCAETTTIVFIFQFKVSLGTRHHFCSASLGKSATTVKQGGGRTCFIRNESWGFFPLERKLSCKLSLISSFMTFSRLTGLALLSITRQLDIFAEFFSNLYTFQL